MTTRYAVTLYHDEPDDASADVGGLDTYYHDELSAIRAAQEAITVYWQSASVERGTYTPAVYGIRPDHFETDDDQTAVRVGAGWIER